MTDERPLTEQIGWLRAAQSAREAARRRHTREAAASERATAQLVVREAPAWVTEEAKRDYLRGA